MSRLTTDGALLSAFCPAVPDFYVLGCPSTKARVLAESSIIRLVSTWEIFIAELAAEYIHQDPTHFKDKWHVRGKREAFIPLLTELHNRPFQNWNKAKDVLRWYLGTDILPKSVGWEPVTTAIALRNQIIHAGGKNVARNSATRNQLGLPASTKNRTAVSYLEEAVTVSGHQYTSRFEWLQTGIVDRAHRLNRRAWLSPRPP